VHRPPVRLEMNNPVLIKARSTGIGHCQAAGIDLVYDRLSWYRAGMEGPWLWVYTSPDHRPSPQKARPTASGHST
jgi:hypothetical protein